VKGKITLWPLIAAVYLMVFGGPFGLEDTVANAGYTGAILILLLTPFLWALPAALMVSELSSALPQEGGYYVWAKRALGPFWGFQEAWLSLVGSVFDMALYPTLFVSYIEHFNPGLTSHGKGIFIGVALIAACALYNILGAKAVGTSSFIFTALLLSPFAALAIYGACHPGPAQAHAAKPYDFLLGMLVAMWNFMGWDNSSTIAGEVDRPQWTYPRAMAGSVTLVALSCLIPIGAVAVTGLSATKWSTGGWAEVSRAVIGGGPVADVVAVTITIAGMMGAAGALNALTLTLSRLPAVLADDGYLPRPFARRHARTGVPWVALIACAIVWALALNLSFARLVILDVLLTGLSILLEFACLIALRIREPELHRPYRVPGGLAGAIGISVFPLLLLIGAVARNKAEPIGPLNALQLGAILIACGVVFYFLSARFRSKTS
jgi:amino acid transporter